MDEFMTIEEMNQILTDLADQIPNEYYRGLSGGIILLEEAKLHKEAINNDLFIMGEYKRTSREKQIRIYYGSFKTVYRNSSRNTIIEKLDEVLKHELLHHLEYNAGFKDLIDEDKRNIDEYKRRRKG